MARSRRTGKLTLLVALALGGCSGGIPPANTGQNGSRLAPCPASPNCVSSLTSAESQRVEALRYSGDAAQAQSRLLSVLKSMERVHIVRVEEGYIHAEFRSVLLSFVDDVEFLFDPPGAIQMRSASLLGYSDFGVNRERAVAIRARFAATDEAN